MLIAILSDIHDNIPKLRPESESTFVSYETESGVVRRHVIDADGRVTSQPV